MSKTTQIVEPDGHTVTLHWNSRIARLGGGINMCITISAHHVLVSRDWITGPHLAHELQHTRQAQRLGWRFIPWVLWGYLRHGYATSPAERDADAYMAAHGHEYQSIGPVPAWVVP